MYRGTSQTERICGIAAVAAANLGSNKTARWAPSRLHGELDLDGLLFGLWLVLNDDGLLLWTHNSSVRFLPVTRSGVEA